MPSGSVIPNCINFRVWANVKVTSEIPFDPFLNQIWLHVHSPFEVYTIWDNWTASKNETCWVVCTSIAIWFSYPKLYKLSCFGKCLRYFIDSAARKFIQFGITEPDGNTCAKAPNIYDVSNISVIPNCINLIAIQNQNLKFIPFGITELFQKMKHVG